MEALRIAAIIVLTAAVLSGVLAAWCQDDYTG